MRSKLGCAVLIGCICLLSCTHDNKQSVYPLPKVTCLADTLPIVSFSLQIQPIFRQNCALSGCHTATDKAGGLNLDSASAYQSLLKSGSGYINTNDPSASLLYSQMNSTNQPMPPTGNLDSCTTKLILKWITQSALNN